MFKLKFVYVSSTTTPPNTEELQKLLNEGWKIVPGHPITESRHGTTGNFVYLLQIEEPDTKAPGASLGGAGVG